MNKLVKFVNNNKGITLVELLATLVIVSIIGTLTYSVLFQGYSNYQRIQVESELRDEADLIMSSFIKEVFLLKNSEVAAVSKCSGGETKSYIGQTGTGSLSPNYFTGFDKNQLKVNGKVIQFYNKNIDLKPTNCNSDTSPTLITESEDGKEINIIFTLTTKKGKNVHEMKFENTLQVINDTGGS